jgi:hypothetical protein
MTLSILSITKLEHYAERYCAECCDLFIGMLNVIMLSVIILNVAMLSVVMLNGVMLNVVMLNVVAPKKNDPYILSTKTIYLLHL